MLAVMRSLKETVDFTALAPPEGKLADALLASGINCVPGSVRDVDGTRKPAESIARQIRDAVSQSKADLLHANSLSMGRVTGRLQSELPVPCTAHLRDIMKTSRRTIEELNLNAGMVAVSEATKRFHCQHDLAPSKTTVIHNGVDLKRYRPREKSGQLREELRLPPDTIIALSIGQICLRKGHDMLAKATIAAIREIPNLHLVVAGERYSSKPESIAFEENFTDAFRNAGLMDRLHMVGYRVDIPSLMNEADLLIHAAKQEPLGRVLLEASASGLPIVATEVGGTAEILPPSLGIPLVPSGDASTMSERIIHLCNSEDERSRQAKLLRENAVRHFSIEAAARRHREFWQSHLC